MSAAPSPGGGPGGESCVSFCFCSPGIYLFQRKSYFLLLRVLKSMERQCATPCFLTLAHDPFCQQPREYGSGTMYLSTHLWHMASTAAVMPLGLLHMRPLQHWLHSRVPGPLDRAPTRAVGSASSLTADPATVVGQAHASPHGLASQDAVHILGKLNRAADALPHQLTFPRVWRLHPDTNRLIWSRFGEAQVELFTSHESSHCQLYFSLTEGPLGIDALAHSWPRALRKYAFPPVSLLAQTLCKLREDEEQVLLVAPHWPTRTWFPEIISLATAPPWPIPLRKDLLSQGLGTIWHPDLWNLHVWLLDGKRQTWAVYHRQW